MEPVVLDEHTMQIVNGLILGFSVISIARLLNDIICACKRKNRVEQALVELTNEIRELKEAIQPLEETASEAETCVDDNGQAQEDQAQEDQAQEDQAQEDQAQVPDVDKHAILRTKLTNNQELFVSYKKTTFLAKYELKDSAPHGYVLKYDNAEYVTPSQFSFKLKKTLNPSISSDNGWDTVYIITGHNDKGKPLKKSLKKLVA